MSNKSNYVIIQYSKKNQKLLQDANSDMSQPTQGYTWVNTRTTAIPRQLHHHTSVVPPRTRFVLDSPPRIWPHTIIPQTSHHKLTLTKIPKSNPNPNWKHRFIFYSNTMHDEDRSALTLKSALDFLNGAGDEIIDGFHRLHRELRRRQAIHQYLERHGQERPAHPLARPAVGHHREARRQERHVGGVASVHDHVHRGNIDWRVDHKRPRRVCACLL